MMGVTHVFAGIVSAVVFTEPKSAGACLAAVAGGTLGGIICDMDLKKKNRLSDWVPATRITVGILTVCLVLDWYLDTGLIQSIFRGENRSLMAGATGMALLCVWCTCQPHRGGAHSILAVVLFGICVELICPRVSKAFVIGMVSHLALDLLNSKPLQLLYPLRGGYCLGLCKADGQVNRLLLTLGVFGSVLGIGICIGKYL